MKFEYTGRHIEVTPAIRSHVEDLFSRLDHLFDGNSSTAHVIIEVERGQHRSEIIVNCYDHVLTAASSVSDMYKSLSQTVDKIEKQALKLKYKITDRHQKDEKISTIPAEQAEVAPAPATPRIIETNNYPVKPMTPEEAVLRLDEEENQFLVFRNADDQRVSVVYKRKDENYGLIKP